MDTARSLLRSLGAIAVVYLALQALLPKSQIPLLVSVFLATNMFLRSLVFRSIINPHTKPVEGVGNRFFKALPGTRQRELLSALKLLQLYHAAQKSASERRRKLFKMMTWRQQQLCNDVGYSNKLNKLDQLSKVNQQFLDGVTQFAFDRYDLSHADLGKGATDSSVLGLNYRVIETLGHFARDWLSSEEIRPLIDYIQGQLATIIPKHEQADTCVIVPGLGLGRIAHEIARLGDYQVHAVEFLGLMHLCHAYIYLGADAAPIYPYIHTCSNFTSTDAHYRHVDVVPQLPPPNLELDMSDFRFFELGKPYKNVVVVLAFFIDTAENLMDYFDAITKLTAPPAKGFWINIGPLKYGLSPQVELNAEEIEQIRHKLGWHYLDYRNDVTDTVGYITDKQLMWQGYYGTTRWTLARQPRR